MTRALAWLLYRVETGVEWSGVGGKEGGSNRYELTLLFLLLVVVVLV